MIKLIWIVPLVLFVLYVLAIRGKKTDFTELRTWKFAHRGLHGDGIPENSMAAFRKAQEKGYGIELDVHLMKDGTLAVIHDSNLSRTAGVDAIAENLTLAELKQYRLEGTDEEIPTLTEVLDMFRNPIIIELKSRNGNARPLCTAVCNRMDVHKGSYVIESFDPAVVRWFMLNRPEIIRGQLANRFTPKETKMNWLKCFWGRNLLFNFLTKPQFIAYNFDYRKCLANRIATRLWGVQPVYWTIRTPGDLRKTRVEKAIPIFENFEA